MKERHDLLDSFREIENVWIRLSDGCRLAARLWLPRDAERVPVPAILEYLPYRKRDGTRWRDEPMHRWFAAHGYASVRVDLRGSGDSDGHLADEYLEREQLDGLEIIEWIASQTWCTGAVGMIGKSWGGFNALQIAQHAPPALRAVIAVCAADDRYADDAHYMGGCLLNENLTWGSVLFTLNALPPDPELVGPGWGELWRERLERAPLFVETWMRHPLRDDYWRQGSVCEDYGRIRCPVYAIGGWADAYSNAVLRLVEGLGAPSKGLIGPWAHVYPHRGVPGPAIGFLQEALRWWQCWLAKSDDGISDEPRLRVWMQERTSQGSELLPRPGRWVAERDWPSSRIQLTRLELGTRDPQPRSFRSPQIAGVHGGSWCAFGLPGELSGDQRAEDGRSLCFDWPALKAPLEILGAPLARLELSVDRPVALLVARLCDVDPDGSSERVTYGVLNLCHRDSHATPAPLEPGKRYSITLRLNDVAHVFGAGSRLRLALSTAYWPMIWPSPEPVTLTVHPDDSSLELPARPPHALDEELRPFGAPESVPGSEAEDDEEQPERSVTHDLVRGRTTVQLSMGLTPAGLPALSAIPDIGLETAHSIEERFTIERDDPLSARAEVVHNTITRRGSWSARVRTRTLLSSTRDEFELIAELEAFEGDRRIVGRTWERRLPRLFL